MAGSCPPGRRRPSGHATVNARGSIPGLKGWHRRGASLSTQDKLATARATAQGPWTCPMRSPNCRADLVGKAFPEPQPGAGRRAVPRPPKTFQTRHHLFWASLLVQGPPRPSSVGGEGSGEHRWPGHTQAGRVPATPLKLPRDQVLFPGLRAAAALPKGSTGSKPSSRHGGGPREA